MIEQTYQAVTALVLRYDAHRAERAYLAAKRDKRASGGLFRAWVKAKAKAAQAEVRL